MSGLVVAPTASQQVLADEGQAPDGGRRSTASPPTRAQRRARAQAKIEKLASFREKPVIKGIIRTVKVFNDAHVLQLAASIAFFVLLSLGPVVLVLLSIAGFVFGEDAVQGRVFGALHNMLGDSSALFIQDLVERSAGKGQGVAAVVGLLLFFWTASGVFSQLSDALEIVRRVAAGKSAKLPPSKPPAKSRWRKLARGGWSLVRSRVMSALVIVAAATLLALSLVASSVITVMTSTFDAWIGTEWIIATANAVVSFLLFGSLTGVIYRVLAHPHLPVASAIVGGVVAAALFLFCKSFVALVLPYAASETSFGPAASVIAVLIWAWFSATTLLVGCAAGSVHDRFSVARAGKRSVTNRAARASQDRARASSPSPPSRTGTSNGALHGATS